MEQPNIIYSFELTGSSPVVRSEDSDIACFAERDIISNRTNRDDYSSSAFG